ncbi:hypothetical protein [Nocardia sp. NPDC051570]|uniref:hypothetical protein n=1 Tax=Nocardia sp. NPDC051570 TaxID=3364324 RepID=UPI003790497D
MGMNKAGQNQQVDSSGGSVKLTQWTPRDGYPGTIISPQSELLPNGSGSVVVHCGIQLELGWNDLTAPLVVELMYNESPFARDQFRTGQAALVLKDAPLTVAPGGRIWVRMSTTATLRKAQVLPGANTYVAYDPA